MGGGYKGGRKLGRLWHTNACRPMSVCPWLEMRCFLNMPLLIFMISLDKWSDQVGRQQFWSLGSKVMEGPFPSIFIFFFFLNMLTLFYLHNWMDFEGRSGTGKKGKGKERGKREEKYCTEGKSIKEKRTVCQYKWYFCKNIRKLKICTKLELLVTFCCDKIWKYIHQKPSPAALLPGWTDNQIFEHWLMYM